MVQPMGRCTSLHKAQLAKRGRGIGLRVGVKKVGCSGFTYTYDYADEVRDDDQLFESQGTKLVVDGKSLEFIDGSHRHGIVGAPDGGATPVEEVTS